LQNTSRARRRRPEGRHAEEEQGGAQNAALVAFQGEGESEAEAGAKQDPPADEIRLDESAADADNRREEKRKTLHAAAGDAATEAGEILPGRLTFGPTFGPTSSGGIMAGNFG